MGSTDSVAREHDGEIDVVAERTFAPIYCAVDRKLIGKDGQRCYYALTVNRWDTEVVMLAFCLDHHVEWLQIRNIICQEGWR